MGRTRALGCSIVAVAGLLAVATLAVPVAARPAADAPAHVGPERPVAHPVPGTPQQGADPAIASGGSVHLVAWRDTAGDVRAARLDRTGAVMDVPGIRVSGGAVGRSPAVAFDGANFLVAWVGTDTVLAKRVSPGGAVLDGTGIELSAPAPILWNPAIAFDGTNHLVIWNRVVDQGWDRGDIHGTRVSPAGTVVGARDVRITDAPGLKERPSIAFAGSHHLVVWDDSPRAGSPDVSGTLVTTSGEALDPGGFPIAAAPGLQREPVVTAVGGAFFVAWISGLTDTDVHGARVAADGSVLDPSGIPLATAGWSRELGIASDGTTVLVTSVDSAGAPQPARGVRVDPSGAVLDPTGIVLPLPANPAAVAFGGDHFVVAAGGYQPVRGTRVTSGGAVLDPAGITISAGSNAQLDAQVVSDGTNDLVVWFDDRVQGEGRGLYGARVGPDGQVLDGTGFPIATGFAREDEPLLVSLAFDGTTFLVVWGEVEEHAVSAARVSRSGAVLDRFDLRVDPDGWMRAPKVVFGGGVFLVAWDLLVQRDGRWVHEIRGTRVSTAGDVLDPAGLLLVDGEGAPGSFDLAFGAADFLLVWQAGRGEGVETDVRGALVTPAGSVREPGGFPIADAAGWQRDPQVAWNGSTHLVVWGDSTEPPTTSSTSDVRGARVDGAGTVLDPSGIAVSTAPGGQSRPTVAAHGPFLVTWTDRRRGADTLDLFGSRVDPDGAVAHPDGIEVAAAIDGSDWRGVPVVAAPGPGDFTVAYQRYLAEPPHAASRTFLRKVSPK